MKLIEMLKETLPDRPAGGIHLISYRTGHPGAQGCAVEGAELREQQAAGDYCRRYPRSP